MTPSLILAGRVRIEPFAMVVVVGGLAMVAGLWLVELFDVLSTAWVLGVGVTALGLLLLGAGINSQVEADLL